MIKGWAETSGPFSLPRDDRRLSSGAMRVAIRCDGRTLAEWQRRAVELIAGKHERHLLACAEPPPGRDLVRHGAYYALNLAAIRNRLTRRVAFPDVPIASRVAVTPQVEGQWASLPPAAW